MKKVRLLEKVNNMIQQHIQNFWEGIPIDPSHLTITHDTKIPLYIFMIIKSKIVNLAANIKFINEFTTSYVHGSYLGNNLALYESAMTIVADKEKDTIYNVIDQNEIYRQATARFGSFATSVFNEDLDPFFEFEDRNSFLYERMRE
uniref:VPS9 domain-containing protein n=1 Tax=Euplotes crassus TaxID=5936 RepID=A0A7S3NTJ7_EUPCR|mmetsp:Transcript_30239/g.29732  ORF Transcript_30239/g.29732 Transcript_30239/m.29732 type:complete len:146 (+) Transcript_30239:1676-2113(+)